MKNKYKLLKVFDCQDMPSELMDTFFEITSEQPNHCYVSWWVEGFGDMYEELEEEYLIKYKKIDKWLIENGANPRLDKMDGEEVIINHSW